MKYSNQTVTIAGHQCKQVNKTKAKSMYESGQVVWLHPCNIALSNPWQSPRLFSKHVDKRSFSSIVGSFECYTDPSLGRYANFFVMC